MDLEFLTVSNDSGNEAFEAILSRRLSRRAVLKAGLAGLALGFSRPLVRVPPAAAANGFAPVAHSKEDRILLPPGYSFDVVIRWGDPLFADAPGFDPAVQSVARQARQLGYNCDFVGYLPLPLGSRTAGHGLLVINQEYTNPELMFPGWDGKLDSKTKEMVDIEMAAHGVSIVEVRRGAGGRWTYLQDSPLNRRLTAETPMRLSGPAHRSPLDADVVRRRRGLGARHAEQLRGRRHAVGHGALGRGELPLLFWGGPGRRARCGPRRQSQTLRVPRPLWVGAPLPAVRSGRGTARAAALRLGGRDRPVRSPVGSGETNGAGPCAARGRHRGPGARGAGRRLFGRRRALRIHIQIRQRRAVRRHEACLEPGTARFRHPLRRPIPRRWKR